MSGRSFWLGQSVQLRVAFTGPGRAPQEVGGVVFRCRRPDGTTTTVAAEDGGSPGLWVGYLTVDQAGVWKLRATCATPRPAVDEAEFRVMPSAVV